MRFRKEYDAWKLTIDEGCATLLQESWGSRGILSDVVLRAGSLGGKRLRAVLLCKAAELVGGDPRSSLPAACAIEFLHSASLLLDDLPCMDNASTRRGLQASHLVFGDSATILGAIALTNEALRLITRSGVTAGLGADSIGKLVDEAVGCVGELMVGQVADLRRPPVMEAVGLMHLYQMKTGVLFGLPVRLGSRLAHASQETLDQLDRYAQLVGIAFQILDDLLDYHATTAEAKKDTGKDAGRPNAVTLWGDSGAEQRARQLLDEALGLLEPWGERAWFFTDLVGFLWAQRWRRREAIGPT